MIAAPVFQPRRPVTSCHGVAAVVEGPRRVSLREVELQEPGPNEVRIRLEGCGVCGSNLPLWEGRPWFDYPREPGAPGHEGWGVVEAVGDRVSQFVPGDRVAALSYHAFATHDFASMDQVVRLPDLLEGMPFPGEAVGCAMNVLRRCQIQPGETVAVVGIGFLGALLVQLAAAASARVVALSRREFSLQVSRSCGAELALCSANEPASEQVYEYTKGVGCDCVIEATGLQAPLDLASKLVKTRGRLVIAGYHQDGPRTIDMQSWNWRGIDVVNAHERDSKQYVLGMEEGIQAIAAGRIRLSELLTHEFSLQQLHDALQVGSDRPKGFLKAWIRCS